MDILRHMEVWVCGCTLDIILDTKCSHYMPNHLTACDGHVTITAL